MEDFFKSRGFKIGAIIVVAIIALMILSPFAIVGATDRGVRVRLGAVQDGVIKPGLVLKFPIIESVQTYTIQPREVKIRIPVGANGAITKDNQTVGVEGKLFYRAVEARVVELARGYDLDKIGTLIETNCESAIKEVIGGYTIFDLAMNQSKVIEAARAIVADQVKGYPGEIVDLKITNYDWSDDFDAQIKETMNRTQQVKQKEQDLLVAQAEAQKQVKQAEAAKQATVLAAEAQRDKAALDAEAKVLEGEGIRKYNQAVAVNWDIELKKIQLDIERIKAEKWDGHYVPTNNYGPIPVSTGSIQGR